MTKDSEVCWYDMADANTVKVLIEEMESFCLGVNSEWMVVVVDWLFRFYGISIFIGYLMPNPFLYK